MLMKESFPGEPESDLNVGEQVSYLSDNIVALGMDLGEDLVRWIRILKSRGSAHDGLRHPLRIGSQGLTVE
jgi:hypothetical protein